MRMIHLAVLAMAMCLVAGGCISANGLNTSLAKLDGQEGVTPLSFPYCKLVTPVAPPMGFSSTYQKYMLDRQRQARRAEQDALATASAKSSPEIDGKAESR
jgi:hypothetical protein